MKLIIFFLFNTFFSKKNTSSQNLNEKLKNNLEIMESWQNLLVKNKKLSKNFFSQSCLLLFWILTTFIFINCWMAILIKIFIKINIFKNFTNFHKNKIKILNKIIDEYSTAFYLLKEEKKYNIPEYLSNLKITNNYNFEYYPNPDLKENNLDPEILNNILKELMDKNDDEKQVH